MNESWHEYWQQCLYGLSIGTVLLLQYNPLLWWPRVNYQIKHLMIVSNGLAVVWMSAFHYTVFVQCYCESCTSCNYLQVQRLKNVQWRLAEPALLLPWCACVTAPQTICVSLEQRQEKCTCGRVLLWEDLCRLTKGLSVLCTHCARQHKRWVKSTSQVWLTVMLSWSTAPL